VHKAEYFMPSVVCSVVSQHYAGECTPNVDQVLNPL